MISTRTLCRIKNTSQRQTRYRSFRIRVETDIFDSRSLAACLHMESQLKQQGAGDKLKEVLAEVPTVRKVAG